MAEIKGAGLRSIVAGMMERQAESARAAPRGVVGGLWEKATGEIERYNEAVKKQIDLKTKQQRTLHDMEQAQKTIDKLNREIAEGLHDEADAAEEASKKIEDLTKEIEQLHESNEDLAESVNLSTERLEAMQKGGGILKNGLTLLAAKTAGAAAAFFGFREAIRSVDERLKLASKTVGDFGVLHVAPSMDKTEDFSFAMYRLAGAAKDWHDAISGSSWELTKLGINAEESRRIVGSYAEGLRLTTIKQGDLIRHTQQMTEDTGFLATMLRVNTDELATATVDASKRFGKSTQSMADELAGLYYSFQGIKESSRGTVVNFGDLTRATLEAQSSFQGYNFNLRATANILGNVVARAQEQGATYEMSMKAAKGLAGVLTGGKAPDWAKYIAGRDLLKEVRNVVSRVEREGVGEKLRESIAKQFKIGPDQMKVMSDTALMLAKEFSLDPTTAAGKKQIQSLQNLSENWRKYGPLSSAKMTEEALRGTDKGMAAMFKMMKKHADKPEGREMLMRVWGIDEAAATAALLSLQNADNLKDFAKLRDDAQAATNLRKPPTVADLKEQSLDFAKAVGKARTGIMGSIKDLVDWVKQNPIVGGAVGAAGTLGTVGIEVMQAGIGNAFGQALFSSPMGKKLTGGLDVIGKFLGKSRSLKGMGDTIAGSFKGTLQSFKGTAQAGAKLAAESAVESAKKAAKAASESAVVTAAKKGSKFAVETAGKAKGAVKSGAAFVAETAAESAGKAAKAAGRAARTAGTAAKTAGTAAKAGSKIAATSARAGAGVAVDVMTSAAQSMKSGIGKAMTGLKGAMGRAAGGIANAAAAAAPALGGVGKAALPLLGKAGLVGLALGVGAAVGSLIRLIPGVDKFTENLFHSAASLMGFKKAVNDAEASQAAMNNESAGIVKAVQQMTAAVTTDFDKDSVKRMIGVRQLQDAKEEDLAAYAKKIAERTGMSEAVLMERLKQLRSETPVDNAEFLRRKQAEEERVARVPGGAVLAAGTLARPDVQPTALAARQGRVTAPRRADRRGRRGVGRTPEAANQRARVGPDGSISVVVNIPTDSIAQSNATAAGMSE